MPIELFFSVGVVAIPTECARLALFKVLAHLRLVLVRVEDSCRLGLKAYFLRRLRACSVESCLGLKLLAHHTQRGVVHVKLIFL